MPKKKKPTKEQRREARLRKGAQWLTTYHVIVPGTITSYLLDVAKQIKN